MVACVGVGCEDRSPSAAPYETWLTEPSYEFGTDPTERVLLSQVPYLRVAPNGERIFVIDLVDVPVSAWTPDGSVTFVARRGEGPGEFTYPTRIFVNGDGSFVVREGFGSRFTYYSADGRLEEAVAAPQGSVRYQQFRLNFEVPTHDGGYLATANIPARFLTSAAGGAQVERSPVLALRPSGDDRWHRPEPVSWLDERSRFMAVPMGGEFRNGFIFGSQPFGAADQVQFEPGRMVVMRTDAVTGKVGLTELGSVGDTMWTGVLELEPMMVTDRMVEEAWEVEPRSPAMSEAAHRRAWEEALYRPDYVPVARSFFLSASGEVWVTTRETSDTLRAYYAMSRGDSDQAPRRVLVPERLTVHDATRSHVWGIQRDALGTPRIVGRRLVPPQQ